TPDQLPDEPTVLGLAWSGYREPFDRFNTHPTEADLIDFYDVKGAISLVLERIGITDVTFEAAGHTALHPGRTARISAEGENVGILGEVRPDLAADIGVDDVRLVVAELDLTRLLALRQDLPRPVITVDRY